MGNSAPVHHDIKFGQNSAIGNSSLHVPLPRLKLHTEYIPYTTTAITTQVQL